MTKKTEVNLVFCGWVFFTASSLFYIASSLRAGDTVGLMAAVFFFMGCVFFFVPFLASMRRVYRG